MQRLLPVVAARRIHLTYHQAVVRPNDNLKLYEGQQSNAMLPGPGE
jgi:hypothetical protein